MHLFAEILLVSAVGLWGVFAALILASVLAFSFDHIVDFFRALPRHFSRRATAVVLMAALVLVTVPMSGCNTSEFETVLNEVGPAVSIILQIVSLAGGKSVGTSVVQKIDTDVAALTKLYQDWEAAAPSGKITVEAEIAAAFQVLNSDLADVYNLTGVKDSATQAKISDLIQVVESAVELAESLIPAVGAKAGVTHTLTPSDLVVSYNKVLTAKTGNKAVDDYTKKEGIHIHGKVLRGLTLGIAK